jgi:hypothetical protein
MKAYSGSTSEGFLPATTPGTSASATAVAPAPKDPSAKFTDFLQEQEDGSASTGQGIAAWAQAAIPTATTPGATSAITPPVTPTPAATPLATAILTTPPAPAALPSATFLAMRTLNVLPTTPDAKTNVTPPTATVAPVATEDSAPVTAETSPTGVAKTLAASMPLSMIMAHAAILASTTRNAVATPSTTAPATKTTPDTTSESDLATPAAPVFTLPIFQLLGKSATTSIAEKKSAAPTPERSFLQASGDNNSSLAMALGLATAAAGQGTQPATSTTVTTTEFSSIKGLGGVSAGGLASAGMANGKKDGDMNATLEMPSLVASTGTNPLVTRTSADVHILLGSNKDFHEALEQVVHVADLSNLSKITPPLRVAIEIQTPPGAIVNVYVSRQADSYRAQLSTDDPVALTWVQDQISSLKQSSDSGVPVRWLPAQLDASPAAAASTSAGSDRNLDWNRGQNQQGYQDANERQQSSRQQRNSYADDSTEEAHVPFLETLGIIGGAA